MDGISFEKIRFQIKHLQQEDDEERSVSAYGDDASVELNIETNQILKGHKEVVWLSSKHFQTLVYENLQV